MFREVDVSALLALREREALVVLGKSLLDFMPFCIIRWIVRRVGEVLRLRSLGKGGPVADVVVPVKAGEEGSSCEDAE